MTKPELINALRSYTHKDTLDYMMTLDTRVLEKMLMFYKLMK